MATQIKTPRSDLYQQDLYAWSKAQVDLLRAGASRNWTSNT